MSTVQPEISISDTHSPITRAQDPGILREVASGRSKRLDPMGTGHLASVQRGIWHPKCETWRGLPVLRQIVEIDTAHPLDSVARELRF